MTKQIAAKLISDRDSGSPTSSQSRATEEHSPEGNQKKKKREKCQFWKFVLVLSFLTLI